MLHTNLAILVPTYNEEKYLIDIIRMLYKSNYSSIIVDDGSTDSTKKILNWLDRSNGVDILSYYHNQGKGFAVKRGAYELIKKGFEWMLVFDSDGQNDINDISQFENALKNHPDAKIIIGNRLHDPKNMPKIRYITNKVMSWFVSLLARQKIKDTQCGYRLIHKSVFNLPLKSNRFEFESEMLIKAGRKGYKIISVPIKCIYEEGRISKINPIKDMIRFFQMIKNLL